MNDHRPVSDCTLKACLKVEFEQVVFESFYVQHTTNYNKPYKETRQTIEALVAHTLQPQLLQMNICIQLEGHVLGCIMDMVTLLYGHAQSLSK